MPRTRVKSFAVKTSEVTQNTQVVDATGQVLGRLATRVAMTLMGKDKPTYTPNVLSGDRVVVINAAKVRWTGNKADDKMYYRHSGHVGNLKSFRLRDMMAAYPDRVVKLAIKGMLPTTELGREMLRRLRVYPGDAPEGAVIIVKPTAAKAEAPVKPEAKAEEASAEPKAEAPVPAPEAAAPTQPEAGTKPETPATGEAAPTQEEK